ncbi:MAG: acyl-CoA dehydrogenase family protein [Actinomycetota bacterium]
MDLDFTPEQEAFRKSVREFAERELAPSYLERAKKHEYPWDVHKRMAQLGYLGLMFSTEWGGGGADAVTAGIVVEEIARVDFNSAYMAMTSALGFTIIERLANETIKQETIPGMISGDITLAVALTEPGAGSDPLGMTTKAVRTEGGWLLSGEKTSVSLIGHASHMLVLAKTNPEAFHRGITAFIVRGDAKGLARQTFRDHGFRPTGRGAVAFDDVFVPDDHVLGEEGGAFKMIMNTFDFTRALIGLTAIAAASGAIEEAAEYAKERKTFGRSILQYQGVAFPLVEHATRLEAAKWLCYRALWLRDNARPHTKEAAMCKWWCPKIAKDALEDCLLTYGHVAYSDEHPIGQKLLDVIGSQIGDGTAQIQKIIIAREMFGRDFVPM